ncbi:MAG: hypothetical protein JXR19_11435 [Bacteroidia bacterium]
MGRIVKIAFFSIVVVMILYGIMYLIWGDNGSESGANIGLTLGVVLMIVAAAGVLVASASNLIHHPKAGLRVLIGLVIFGVLALIGYSAGGGQVLESYYDYGVTTVGESKRIDAELYVMYGLGILAFLAIIASEISAAIKR